MSDLAIEEKPKSKITSAEMERRREGLRQADAHNRIEGQFPSPECDAIFEAFICGDIEQAENPAAPPCLASQALTFARLYSTGRINPQEQARGDSPQSA